MLLVVLGDESAAPLAPDQQVAGRHLVQRLADRALAHIQLRGQLELAGQQVAGAPIAADQALHQQILYLLVERAEPGEWL